MNAPFVEAPTAVHAYKAGWKQREEGMLQGEDEIEKQWLTLRSYSLS